MALPQQEQQAYQRGADLFDEGEFAHALQLFNTLVQQFPDDARVNFALGLTWNQLGDREKAIRYLQKSAGLAFYFPSKSNPYAVISNIVSLDAENSERRPWLDRALQWAIASKSPRQVAEARYNLATAEGNGEDALRYVKEALTHAPNDIDLLTYLSAMLLEKGDAEGAREVLQNALQRNLVNFRILYAQGLNYRALHQEAEAMALFEKAMFNPDAIRFVQTPYYRYAARLLTRHYARKGWFRDIMRINLQIVHLGDRLKQNAKSAALATRDQTDSR